MKMKPTTLVFCAAASVLLLAGCGATGTVGASGESGAGTTPATAATPAPAPTATLYMDFTNGSETETVNQVPYEYEGTLTPEILLQGLSETTGLDFFATVTQADGKVTVDWQNDSTLLYGLDEREQKQEYYFYDAQTLDWFMLDTASRTLRENLGAEAVYYTMDNGGALTVPDLWPVSTFAADTPYEGSTAYYAASGGGDGLTTAQRQQAEDFCNAFFGGLDGDLSFNGNVGGFAQYFFTGADGTQAALQFGHQEGDSMYFITVVDNKVTEYVVAFGDTITIKDSTGKTYTPDTWRG
ncbi:MAG: hypothetical protein PHO10_11290 [Gemmiger sp.]|nr:hypothetical protein [Gemmiger sp.]